MSASAATKSTNVRSGVPGWLRAGLHGLEVVMPPLATHVAERLLLTPMRHRTPKSERPLLEAARVLTLPWWPRGRTLVGYAWGAGPPVLLVHGWAGRATQLGAFVAPLVTAGHTVVAFDLPAHGRSDGERTNLLDFRDALLAIGRRHGPFAAVIAHSMGGAAATMAVAHGLSARRLVLISAPTSLRDQTRRFGATLGISAGTVEVLMGRLERRFRAPIESIDLEAVAPRLELPTLVVHDEDDPEVPFEDGARAARLIERARLHATRGLGHRRVLRDPGVVGAVTEFLTGRAPSADATSLEDPIERELFDRDARR